jgi:hypothetical protein
MGVCSCKDSKYDNITNVEVDKLDKKASIPNTPDKNVYKVKSIKCKDPENFQSYTKVSELLDENNHNRLPTTKDNEANNLIIEHEINQSEENAIKRALYNHFLFKEMNEDIL